MYMSHSVGREIHKAMKTKSWDIRSISDTAHHTILILCKDFVLQTIQDSGLVYLLSSISPNSSHHHDLNKKFPGHKLGYG